jgi:hypothetical protein
VTRLLTLLLGDRLYILILAAFLTGLGIGSSGGAALAKTVKNPRNALGMCQLLLVVALAWAGYSANIALPNWPVNPALAPDPMATFQIDLIRACGVARRFPVGNEFPLRWQRGEGPGPAVGGIGVCCEHRWRSRRHAGQPRRARDAGAAASAP